MAFKEIKPSTNFIRIKSFGKTTISLSLVRKFFTKRKVQVFHDEKNKIIGLKPSDEGYKIIKSVGCARIGCAMLSRITTGEYYPIWSETYKMLVFSYG